MTEQGKDLARSWLSPAVLLPAVAFLGGLYVSNALQQERIEALRAQVVAIERDYQRRDLMSAELRAIEQRLGKIEGKLDALPIRDAR